MKSCIGAYLAGCMSMLGIWMVYENKQKIEQMLKNVKNKTCKVASEMSSVCNCEQNTNN
jgi:hypothetical protein